MTSPESEEEAVNLVSYLKSCGSGTQDLHESGRHSEDERDEVMLAGSKWRLTPRSWTWPGILKKIQDGENTRWLSGSPSIYRQGGELLDISLNLKIGSQNIADFVEKYVFEEYLT